MTNNESFNRAQRQYDAQLPPEPSPECEDCDGTGKIAVSNCCGADFAEPGFPDNDLCSQCHEHTDISECETCDGTGKQQKQELPEPED